MKLSRLLFVAVLMILCGSALCTRQKLADYSEDVMRPMVAVQCYDCGTEVVFVDYNATIATCKRCGKVMRVVGEDPHYKLPTKPRTID